MGLKENVDAAINAALGTRIVGCVVLVNRNGERVYSRTAGFADREANRPLKETDIFRLASCTKPIVSAAVLRMSDLGLLGLQDRVTKYLPWFTPKLADGTTPTITIHNLLTHTSGLTYTVTDDISRGAGGPIITLEENLKRLAKMPLAFAPGTAWRYGMSIDVLGAIIATINGSDVEGAVLKYVAGPLGMPDTRFRLPDPARLTTPYGDGKPEPIRLPEPHWVHNNNSSEPFSPARAYNPDAPQSGGGGMVGTAGDFIKVLEALKGDFLKPVTREAAFTNQIGNLPREDAGQRWGLFGSIIADPRAAGYSAPPGTMHWGGSWGNNWVLDRASGLTIVVFTNTMFEGCNGPFRDELREAVYA